MTASQRRQPFDSQNRPFKESPFRAGFKAEFDRLRHDPGKVAYPAFIPEMEFFGPTPTDGTLRCEVREKLIDFLQAQHPEALPRTRQISFDGAPDAFPARFPRSCRRSSGWAL